MLKPLLAAVLLATMPMLAQGTPPILITNVVNLTPMARLAWDDSQSGIAGWWASMAQGTNQWRSFTTNRFMPLATLNSNLTTGTYTFAVAAVNGFGAEGPPATLTTNLSKPPAMVILIRIEMP